MKIEIRHRDIVAQVTEAVDALIDNGDIEFPNKKTRLGFIAELAEDIQHHIESCWYYEDYIPDIDYEQEAWDLADFYEYLI